MRESEMECGGHEPPPWRLQGGSSSMRTAHVIRKRSLFGLFGILLLAAASFSATVPRFLWMAEENRDGLVARPAVKLVSRNSVVAAHALRSRTARKSMADSSATKTAGRIDKKTPQAALAQTGCKDHALVDGAPSVAGGKNTSRKTYTNSTQEKSLCNPESLRSR